MISKQTLNISFLSLLILWNGLGEHVSFQCSQLETYFDSIDFMIPIKLSCMIALRPNICSKFTMRQNRPYLEFFWSAFSNICTEYGDILRIFLHSVRMSQNRDRKTLNADSFHAVLAYPDKVKLLLKIWSLNYICFHLYAYQR